jgi:hypothetical protein
MVQDEILDVRCHCCHSWLSAPAKCKLRIQQHFQIQSKIMLWFLNQGIGSVFAVDCFVAAICALFSLSLSEWSCQDLDYRGIDEWFQCMLLCCISVLLGWEFVLLKAKPHCLGENRYHTPVAASVWYHWVSSFFLHSSSNTKEQLLLLFLCCIYFLTNTLFLTLALPNENLHENPHQTLGLPQCQALHEKSADTRGDRYHTPTVACACCHQVSTSFWPCKKSCESSSFCAAFNS